MSDNAAAAAMSGLCHEQGSQCGCSPIDISTPFQDKGFVVVNSLLQWWDDDLSASLPGALSLPGGGVEGRA